MYTQNEFSVTNDDQGLAPDCGFVPSIQVSDGFQTCVYRCGAHRYDIIYSHITQTYHVFTYTYIHMHTHDMPQLYIIRACLCNPQVPSKVLTCRRGTLFVDGWGT